MWGHLRFGLAHNLVPAWRSRRCCETSPMRSKPCSVPGGRKHGDHVVPVYIRWIQMATILPARIRIVLTCSPRRSTTACTTCSPRQPLCVTRSLMDSQFAALRRSAAPTECHFSTRISNANPSKLACSTSEVVRLSSRTPQWRRYAPGSEFLSA